MKKLYSILSVFIILMTFACANADFTGQNDLETARSNDSKLSAGEASSEADVITIYYRAPGNWMASPEDINIHYNTGNGWTNVPGETMVKYTSQYDKWFDYASITIDASSMTFCFNLGGSQWDNNNYQDYNIDSPGVYEIIDGSIKTVEDITGNAGIYFSIKDGYPGQSVPRDLPVTLYKGETQVGTYYTGPYSHGATFLSIEDLDAGSYKLVMDAKEFGENYKYTGEILFEIDGQNDNATEDFSGTMYVTKTLVGYAGIFFNLTNGSYMERVPYGIDVEFKKDGEIYGIFQVGSYSHGAAYLGIHDLPEGTYSLKINEVYNGVAYRGYSNVVIDGIVEGNNTFEDFIGSMDVTKYTTGDAGIYIDYENPRFPQDSVPVGLPLELYKEGVKIGDYEVGSASHGQPWTLISDLEFGEYTLKISHEQDGIRYTGETLIVINGLLEGQSIEDFTGGLAVERTLHGICRVAFITQPYTGAKSEIYGKYVHLYRNNIAHSSAIIQNEQSEFHSASFEGLSEGFYSIQLNIEGTSKVYTGTVSFDLSLDNPTAYVSINVQEEEKNQITIHYKAQDSWNVPSNTVNIHYNAGSGWTSVPGVSMAFQSHPYDLYAGYSNITLQAEEAVFCFNVNGQVWDNNNNNDYYIGEPGIYVIENGIITKK